MFGRKQKRIEELEGQLRYALENLVNVTVKFPAPVVASLRATSVRESVWHTASFRFMVRRDGWSHVGAIYIGEDDGQRPYFDGSMD